MIEEDSQTVAEDGKETFEYDISLNAKDLWLFSMFNSNRGYMLIFNVLFTIASFVYMIAMWNQISNGQKLILTFCTLMFSVIQPAMLYRKAVLQAKNPAIKAGLKMKVSESGINIEQQEQKADFTWEQVYRTMIRKSMIMIFFNYRSGYLIPERYLGAEREALVELLKKHTKQIGF